MAIITEVSQVLRLAYEPSEVFWEVKHEPPVKTAAAILMLALLTRVLAVTSTSFHFSTVNPEDTDLLRELVRLYVPVFSWVFGTYAVATVMSGEGTLKQVIVASSLSLLPYVLLVPLVTFLTQVLTLPSGLWVRLMQGAAYAWCGYLLFTAVRIIHNYENVLALVVSALGFFLMSVFWALVGIVYSYNFQVVRFVREILADIAAR